MKHLLIAAVFVMAGSLSAHAEKTVEESATATKNDIKRGATKAGNRIGEATCMEGDAKCAAKKAKKRVQEGASKVGDGAKEAADTIDSNDTTND